MLNLLEISETLLYNLKTLRFYAIFKVKKVESLFYKINTFLQETALELDCRQTK